MKLFILSISLLFYHSSFSQAEYAEKIIITLKDGEDAYLKMKDVFVNSNFMVKDLSNKDVLYTYPKIYMKLDMFIVCKATININEIILTGKWVRRGDNFTNANFDTGMYKPIMYFKVSKTWKILLKIAEKVGGIISFQ